MAHPNDGPKRSNNILIAVLALVSLVLLIAFLKPDPIEELQPENAIQKEVEMTVSLNSLSPEDWNELARAEKNIQSLGKGQVITPQIITDPNDENHLYFATSAYDANTEENLVGIYKYNVKDFTFERIYKETRKNNAETGMPAQSLYLAGLTENGLVVMNDRQGFVPQNCAELITLQPNETRTFKRLNFDAPYDEWESFAPSAKITEEAVQKQASCEKAL